jgi:transcriptional regulator with XRE-family HTH domain
MKKDTGEMLKVYRERAGFSRKGVAESIGCTISALSYWETGKRQPDADTFLSLMRLYNVRGVLEMVTDLQNDETKLSEIEWEAVKLFRRATCEGRAAIITILKAFQPRV